MRWVTSLESLVVELVHEGSNNGFAELMQPMVVADILGVWVVEEYQRENG